MNRARHTRTVPSVVILLIAAIAGASLAGRTAAAGSWPEPASESLAEPVLLPNGEEFTTWSDATEYTRVYYVDGRAGNAADSNDGTAERPLKTIQRAAELVQPGEKVVIRQGRYRESVRPPRGGEGADRMIAFEAADGEEVVISGSVVFEGTWVESRRNGEQTSKTLWMADLADALFEGANPEETPPFPLRAGVEAGGLPSAGNPFRTPLASEQDIAIMPWAASWAGRLPYTLPRGLVFQDGSRLVQLSTYEDLPRVPGSYWVEPREGSVRLHVHPRRDETTGRSRNPNTSRIEVTVHQQLFVPQQRGIGYVALRGLTFEHAGNGFPRSGVGAVSTHGGHHWIIEGNVVRHCGSVGIEIGARTNEFYHEGTRPELEARTGYHRVRGNTIHGCGTGGIQGLSVFRALVEENHIFDCGWQDVERYWETAGIKLLNATDTLVQRNHLHDLVAACGIWLDFLNENCRVTRNLVHRVRSYHGGIFLEASQVPNLIDTNVIRDIEGPGIYQHDCDRLVIANNLIAHCTEIGIQMRVVPGRQVGGRTSTSRDNRVVGNVLVDCPTALWFLDDRNVSEHNVIAASPAFDLAAWRARGLGATDVEADLAVSSAGCHDLTWSAPAALPAVPRVAALTVDFLGRPYGDAAEIAPGPFREGPRPQETTYDLSEVVP